MANNHFDVKTISRGKGQSIAYTVGYAFGQRLHDKFLSKTFYQTRDDVLFARIFLPDEAPDDFDDLQILCDRINESEKRKDARLARYFMASLPNELPIEELIKIVNRFVKRNFVQHGLCAMVAIHDGKNDEDPTKNNPHVHIVVSTRTVDADGFSKHKNRKLDGREFVKVWREGWTMEHNRAYRLNHLDIRVSPTSCQDSPWHPEQDDMALTINPQLEVSDKENLMIDSRLLRELIKRNRHRSKTLSKKHPCKREHVLEHEQNR